MTPPTLNVRCDYFRHPKTRRLVALGGVGAELMALRLWAYCGEFYAKDGRLRGYTVGQIEGIAGWTGDEGKGLEALAKSGFIEQKKGVWGMSNWREHQGHIYALKVKGQRMAEARWDQYRRAKGRRSGRDADSIADSNAEGMHRQCHSRSDLPTDPADPPKGSGGRGGRNGQKASSPDGRAKAGAGPFPLPAFTELPRPLFADKAKAMLEDCELTIAEIRKAGKADQGAKDALGQPMLQLLPEAREAIKAWQRRMGEIRQARAG